MHGVGHEIGSRNSSRNVHSPSFRVIKSKYFCIGYVQLMKLVCNRVLMFRLKGNFIWKLNLSPVIPFFNRMWFSGS